MSKLERRLGFCVLCGQRVFGNDSYLKTSDGYCHRNCLTETSAIA